MENEEKIRHDARRRLEEQLKQYRVQRHKDRVSGGESTRHFHTQGDTLNIPSSIIIANSMHRMRWWGSNMIRSD